MLKLLSVFLAGAGVGWAAESGAIAYGKYLVEEVAKCGDCHTRRTAAGALDASNRLKGAHVVSGCEIKNGPKYAPDVTASSELFRLWGATGMTQFLTTALDPRGRAASAPMPAYRLRPHDAEAVVAYLKTLK